MSVHARTITLLPCAHILPHPAVLTSGGSKAKLTVMLTDCAHQMAGGAREGNMLVVLFDGWWTLWTYGDLCRDCGGEGIHFRSGGEVIGRRHGLGGQMAPRQEIVSLETFPPCVLSLLSLLTTPV